MTVKLTAGWDIKSCDGCGTANDTEEEFPEGWCVVVANIDNEALTHKAYCPECEPEDERP